MNNLANLAYTAQADIDHVVALTKASGSSFYWGMRLLPKEKREAMFAIYAFCREVDDIADEPGTMEYKRQALDEWRREIDALFAGQPSKATSRALLWPIATYGLVKQPFLDMIDGMQMDAEGPVVAPDRATFDLYCYRVAGSVGLMAQKVFSDPSPRTESLAVNLGQALQVTNILRDLVEDAEEGRLYLPRDLLARYGISDYGDLNAILHHPRLPAALAELAEEAEAKFAAARADLEACQAPLQKPAIIMMQVYYRLLQAMKERGWQAFADKTGPGKLTKLYLAFRYGLVAS